MSFSAPSGTCGTSCPAPASGGPGFAGVEARANTGTWVTCWKNSWVRRVNGFNPFQSQNPSIFNQINLQMPMTTTNRCDTSVESVPSSLTAPARRCAELGTLSESPASPKTDCTKTEYGVLWRRCIYIYIYICYTYVYMCICVCVYIYIYRDYVQHIYIYYIHTLLFSFPGWCPGFRQMKALCNGCPRLQPRALRHMVVLSTRAVTFLSATWIHGNQQGFLEGAGQTKGWWRKTADFEGVLGPCPVNVRVTKPFENSRTKDVP